MDRIETGAPTGRDTVHATAIVLGTAGILLTGPAGAGKTTLALDLVGAWRAAGRFAALVADDRVRIEAAGGRAIATAPAAIAGLAELAGHGIVRPPAIAAACLTLAGTLVPADAVEAIPGEAPPLLIGPVRLPRVRLPALTGRAAPLLCAALRTPWPPTPAGP